MLSAGSAMPSRCAVAVWLILAVVKWGTEGVPVQGTGVESVIRGNDDRNFVSEEGSIKSKSSSNISTSSDHTNKALAESMPVTSYLSDAEFIEDPSDEELNKTLTHMYDLINTEGEVKYPLEDDLMELSELKGILDFLEAESGADVATESDKDNSDFQKNSEKNLKSENSEGNAKNGNSNISIKPDWEERSSDADVKELSDVAKSRSKRRAPSYLSSTDRLNDERKLRRRSSRRERRETDMTSSYQYDDYSEDDTGMTDDSTADVGMIDDSTAEALNQLNERKLKLAEEVRAEEKLLDALIMQQKVEKAREAAIDSLIYGIESGRIQLSIPISDNQNDKTDRVRKRIELKRDKPVYIPILHKGVRGFFIPDLTISKRESKASSSGSYVDDEDDEWHAVVPESYRANL